jgi:methyltransferase-like protein/ubiquinone/menaquinone biosynthesis C-methylase UbiE
LDSPTSYDVVPYWGNPYRESHPDHLATVAKLFGLTPPAVDRSRVLELGCSSGANLIPMAVALPTAKFVGIDLSQRQVDEGRQTIAALGLTNIELRHSSLETIGPDDGLFDYIICHGVYSWVPHRVQEHILQISSRNLAASGVAYISYNTYPGWFMRGMVRRMMKFHAGHFSDPTTQLEQARALLDFLFEASSGVDATYHALLSREFNILRQCHDSYVFHEHLEEVNEPLFFHEFMERAAKQGLRYLAEPYLSEMVAVNVPPRIAEVLKRLGADIIQFEQYLDFLRNRTFRRTLLCHEACLPRREIGADQMEEFWISSALKRRVSAGSLAGPEAWEFTAPGGMIVEAKSPVHKALLWALEQAWPASLPCRTLSSAAQNILAAEQLTADAATPSIEPGQLRELVLQLHLQNLLEISQGPPRFTTRIADSPRASPLASRQAVAGPIVINLKHERVHLEPLDAELIQHLDGTRDRRALVEILERSIGAGNLTVQNESGPLPAEARTPDLLGHILDVSLASLARNSLLLG